MLSRIDARCYFQRYASQRDLHSFPTRRSSDLAQLWYLHIGHRQRPSTRLPCAVGGGVSVMAGVIVGVGEIVGVRSEEHTSELQSRQYLVCRLLLEKKKCKQHSPRAEWMRDTNT